MRTDRGPALLAVLLGGCGTLGGEGGGAGALPNRGIVPYETTGQLVPEPAGARFGSASAVVRSDRVVLYAAMHDGPLGSVVLRYDSDASGVAFGAPQTVLTASTAPAWLGGHIDAPHVLWADGVGHLVFEADRGRAIGHATSADGRTFSVDAAPLLTPTGPDEAGGIGAPSLVAVGETFELYYEVRGTGPASRRVAKATAADSSLQLSRTGAVLQGGVECTSPDGEQEACWDARGVGGAEVRAATTATGRSVLRMMYDGGAGGVGFAAAWPGGDFERYPNNPVIPGADVRAPSNVRLHDRYLLFYTTAGDVPGIAIAVNAAGHPSEQF